MFSIKQNVILKSLTFLVMMFYVQVGVCNEKKVVYIYNDEGSSSNCVNQTINSLQQILTENYQIKTISAKEIKNTSWYKKAALLIMPGGADLPYVKKLKGEGNKVIKEYVKKGGSYLGICAGAYYGSTFVEFDKGGLLEVVGKRELSFFDGKAIGPVLATYDYKNNSGARAAEIQTIYNKKNIFVYYNGGPYFLENNDKENFEIATYQNKKHKGLKAILGINFGKGRVVLSAVHFEYSANVIDKNDDYLKPIYTKLVKHENERIILIQEILKFLHLNVAS